MRAEKGPDSSTRPPVLAPDRKPNTPISEEQGVHVASTPSVLGIKPVGSLPYIYKVVSNKLDGHMYTGTRLVALCGKPRRFGAKPQQEECLSCILLLFAYNAEHQNDERKDSTDPLGTRS